MGTANEKFQLDKIIKLERELEDTRKALKIMMECEDEEIQSLTIALKNQKELADERLARVRELETELSEIAVASDYVCIDPDCTCNKE